MGLGEGGTTKGERRREEEGRRRRGVAGGLGEMCGKVLSRGCGCVYV